MDLNLSLSILGKKCSTSALREVLSRQELFGNKVFSTPTQDTRMIVVVI